MSDDELTLGNEQKAALIDDLTDRLIDTIEQYWRALPSEQRSREVVFGALQSFTCNTILNLDAQQAKEVATRYCESIHLLIDATLEGEIQPIYRHMESEAKH